MDITINGNLNINGNVNNQENSSAEAAFNGLLDNTASFKDLLACLRKQVGEKEELVKAKRCPGSEQLRNGHRLIAQITVGEATVEVYENGYGIFDNGDRKTVIWIPDCPKAAQYYYPATYDERCKDERHLWGEDIEDDPEYGTIVEGTESEEDRLDEEQLSNMVWYLAVVITGENRIEWNLEHPISAGSRSDKNAEDCGPNRYNWSCGAKFQNPEDAVLYKEEKAERCADLTEKQREIYQLYYVDEYSQTEIGEILGISHQVVCRHLEAIRKKIARYYER